MRLNNYHDILDIINKLILDYSPKSLNDILKENDDWNKEYVMSVYALIQYEYNETIIRHLYLPITSEYLDNNIQKYMYRKHYLYEKLFGERRMILDYEYTYPLVKILIHKIVPINIINTIKPIKLKLLDKSIYLEDFRVDQDIGCNAKYKIRIIDYNCGSTYAGNKKHCAWIEFTKNPMYKLNNYNSNKLKYWSNWDYYIEKWDKWVGYPYKISESKEKEMIDIDTLSVLFILRKMFKYEKFKDIKYGLGVFETIAERYGYKFIKDLFKKNNNNKYSNIEGKLVVKQVIWNEFIELLTKKYNEYNNISALADIIPHSILTPYTKKYLMYKYRVETDDSNKNSLPPYIQCYITNENPLEQFFNNFYLLSNVHVIKIENKDLVITIK